MPATTHRCAWYTPYSLPLRGYPEIVLTGCDVRRAIEEQGEGWLSERRLLAERLAGFQDKYPDVQVRRVVVRERPV